MGYWAQRRIWELEREERRKKDAMGFNYKLGVTCDDCGKVIAGDKPVGSFGGGIKGVPETIPAKVDPETNEVIEPAKPGVVEGAPAWRVQLGPNNERIYCPECLGKALNSVPCEVWAALRIQV